MDRSQHKRGCQFCGKMLRSNKNLRRHENTHTKPFSCVTCGSVFSTKDQLQTHEYLHTGETPFPCSKCDKEFRSMKSQYQHERKVHKYSRCTQTNQKQPRSSPELPPVPKAAPGPSQTPAPVPGPSRAPPTPVSVPKAALDPNVAARPPLVRACEPMASTSTSASSSAPAVCFGVEVVSKPAFLSQPCSRGKMCPGKDTEKRKDIVKRRGRPIKKRIAVISSDSSSDSESDTASQDEQDYLVTYGKNFRRFWKQSEVPLCILGKATVNGRELYLVRLKLPSEPNVGDPYTGVTNDNIVFVYAEKFKKWFPQLVIQHFQESLVLVDMPEEEKEKANEGSDSATDGNGTCQADSLDNGAEEVSKKMKLDEFGLPILDDIDDPEENMDFSDSSDDGIEMMANLCVKPLENGKRQSDFIAKEEDFWG